MLHPRILALVHIGVAAALIWAVVHLLHYLQATTPDYNSFNYFSYFTIQSNVLSAAFFLTTGLRHMILNTSQTPKSLEIVRCALTLFMSLTTSVYWLLLHHLFKIPFGWAYIANAGLHAFALTALLLDLVLRRPQHTLSPKWSVLWLIYPLIYGIYTGIRGAITGWFPYPFTNPETLGSYGWILLIYSILALIFIGVARGVVTLNNRLVVYRSLRS